MASGGRSGGGDRRPTKAERKEEARLKREEIHRRMARRNRNSAIGVAVAVVVAGAIVAVLVLQGTGGGSNLPSPQSLLGQAASASHAAGCSQVQTIGFYNGVSDTQSPDYVDQYHIGSGPKFPSPPPLSTYPSVPPTSGPHAPIPPGPVPAGFYDTPPDIYRAIHDLEHGAAIVWYSPNAPKDLVGRLRDFYTQSSNVDQGRVVVAPYSYPDQGKAGQLPGGVQMALVAWHRLESCGQVNLAAAFSFTARYAAPPYDGQQYLGEAPEPGAAI